MKPYVANNVPAACPIETTEIYSTSIPYPPEAASSCSLRPVQGMGGAGPRGQ